MYKSVQSMISVVQSKNYSVILAFAIDVKRPIRVKKV